MPADTLQLPRTLVNQLLRQAQQSAGYFQGFVLRDSHGRYQCELLVANADLIAVTRLEHTRRPLAFYRGSNAPLAPLAKEQMTALANCTSLYLDIALDTKGVLQLHACRIKGTRAIQMGVTITETAADLQ